MLRLSIAAVVLIAGIAGCERADPLVAIRQQQASGDYEGTIEPLRRLLEERRDDTEVEFLYGRALVSTGQTSSAEWSLRKAMEDPEWFAPAGQQLAYGAFSTGNFDVAIETATRVLEEQPDNVAVLLLRAQAYAHSKLNNEAALADADRILELDPDNLEAMEPRILALLALDRIDEVGEAMDELGRRIDAADLGDAAPAWHCATTAIFADESGDPELAEERWSKCLELHPGNSNVVSNALDFYDGKRDFTRSLEILRAAYAAEPDRRDYRTSLASRLRFSGDNSAAEELLRDATNSDRPGIASSAWIDLAKHQQEVGDYQAAAESVDRAVGRAREVGEPPPQLLLEQADALILAGEFERALAVADAMTLPAHEAMIRARVAQDRGQPAEALAQFDEAFRLWPDNPWARYQAALAAEAVGDLDRAMEEYRYAIRISPEATDARIRIARLLLAEKKPADAMQLLRHKADEALLGVEGEILSLRMWGWLGLNEPLGQTLGVFQMHLPDELGRAVASAAEGLRVRNGAEATLAVLRSWQSEGLIDLAEPRQAAALRAFVRLAYAAGVPSEADTGVRNALAAHPEAAVFHEIHGLTLELADAPDDAVRGAYTRALELDPANAGSLAGLGRLSLASDPEQAVKYFEQAAAADPSDPELQESAARALAAAGRTAAAEERLEAVLLAHPEDGAAAGQLAELQLARGASTDRTLQLAQRAVRFGGSTEVHAWELLARIQRDRHDPEAAERSSERARTLRAGGNG